MSHQVLTSFGSELAEGVLWHPDHEKLYWVDIMGGVLYSHHPASGESELVHQGSQIGGFTIQDDGSLLLFREKGGIELLTEDGIVVLFEELDDETETRFNDVSADPRGRVFCGTMPTPDRKGRLYRLDPDGSIRIVVEDVGCSNGMGWTADEKTMFHTDSGDATIYAWDYDAETGEISNRRIFFKREGEGGPDGMVVDAEDGVWTALWGGRSVLHLSATGEILEEIPIPAVKITCPAFGGEDLADLYVVAAGGNDEDKGEGAGELTKVKVEAKGKPEYRSKIKVKA